MRISFTNMQVLTGLNVPKPDVPSIIQLIMIELVRLPWTVFFFSLNLRIAWENLFQPSNLAPGI